MFRQSFLNIGKIMPKTATVVRYHSAKYCTYPQENSNVKDDNYKKIEEKTRKLKEAKDRIVDEIEDDIRNPTTNIYYYDKIRNMCKVNLSEYERGTSQIYNNIRINPPYCNK